MENFQQLPHFKAAFQLIQQTGQLVFITGKAGTGKTTFLRRLVQSTLKQTVVAAPTGIAAINAGGVTLHSLFHLPFGCFFPDPIFSMDIRLNERINTPETLISKLQMNTTKRDLLRSIELLIIDEVSMLRADTLDAIDHILKHVRNNRAPFGGLQVVFFGDLMQLPPVVKTDEWTALNTLYKSPFFFEAKALSQSAPVIVEFDHVFRQKDDDFLQILNEFRTNEVSEDSLELINSHFSNDYEALMDESYIYITTHNRKADYINTSRLNNLPDQSFYYKAGIKGVFPENSYPNTSDIQLKKGAQVMFIKNDTSDQRRYYNGKIGKISALDQSMIEVSFPDEDEPVIVNKYLWENKRYQLNKTTNEIEEDLQGTFEQYPIRLAWAITVHKSQGLTFERAILDLTDSFAPGQIYVALSRLTALDGLVLASKIPHKAYFSSPSVVEFSANVIEHSDINQILDFETPIYIKKRLFETFDISGLLKFNQFSLKRVVRSGEEEFIKPLLNWHDNLTSKLNNLSSILNNCHSKLFKISTDSADSIQQQQLIFEEMELVLHQTVKQCIHDLEELNFAVRPFFKKRENAKVFNQFNGLLQAELKKSSTLKQFFNFLSFGEIPNQREFIQKEISNQSSSNHFESTSKQDTKEISLSFFEQGLSIKEIAVERELSEGTITSHLIHWVLKGKIPSNHFLEKEKEDIIINLAKEQKEIKLKELKETLGDEFSYDEIKFALAHANFKGLITSS